MEGPARFLPIVLGFFIASYYMTFSSEGREIVDTINRTLITILIFCGLTVFLLFLEVNKSTFNSKNKVFFLLSPFFGFMSAFFIEQKVIFVSICLIILLFNYEIMT